MLQVPVERTGARGPATTGAGLTGANGGQATQPTLDVVLGGPIGAPADSPTREQASTPHAPSEVTLRAAPEAPTVPASETTSAGAPPAAAPKRREAATTADPDTAPSVDIAGTRAADATGAPSSGRATSRAAERAAKPAREPVLINRELSWLDFNGRVLAQVEDDSLPLLERARFLAIASRALDEFFQVRVGGLKQLAAGLEGAASDPQGPQAQVRAIRAKVVDLYARQSHTFLAQLVPKLDRHGIRFSDWSSLDEEDRAHLDKVFEERIFPVLTPLAVDPTHPFPYISSLSLNLMVVVADPSSHEQRIARIKVPPLLSRFVVLPDGERFVPIEQVIAAHLHPLFEGMQVVAHHVFRLTRNADYQLDSDEAEDLVEAVRAVLKERRRSPLVVRLEVGADMPAEMVDLLARELEIDAEDVYPVAAPLDLGGLFDVCKLERPDLKFRPWTPITPPRIAHDLASSEGDLFRDLREDQVLVHHPYDSFEHTVEAFIELAAEDPQVLAIKQTLYRTSGPVSPIIRSLTRAAEAGKQVVALVELTARFDEQNNINWAEVLEDAGVHVVYGAVGLKTHAKVTLVVREEPGGIRRYCHVGTGNYNRDTARVYEDLGLLSADAALGADVGELFNSLTGYSHQAKYRKLLVAPGTMRPALLKLIRREAERGEAGRIVIKVNNLVDPEMIGALCAASQAGVEIDLVVRSICCLRPGVPGVSENIRVRSLVGRYLEHSRILRFGRDPHDAEYYISSADLMPRNLDRRVEAAVPIRTPELRARLDQILEINLKDDTLAWELGSNGEWRRVASDAHVDTQVRLQEVALRRGEGKS
jgi:polyphosphate kinase